MRISKEHKFVFISTPKAATHSIYKMLKEHYSKKLLEGGFHSTEIPSPYRRYFRWTICRNPFSRAVSLWWSGCKLAHLDQYKFRERCGSIDDFTQFMVWLAGTSLEERGLEPLMNNQTDWLAPVEPVHAIHLEHLKEELNQLPFWKKEIELPWLNTTSQKIESQIKNKGQTIIRPPWWKMYREEEAIEAVLNWAGNDFERFGYSKEIPHG